MDAAGSRGLIELLDALDEFGSVRKIHVVDAQGKACLDHSIRIGSISLERTRRIDHESRCNPAKLTFDLGITVEVSSLACRPHGQGFADGERFRCGSARDHERQGALIGKQMRKPRTKHSVSTEYRDPQSSLPSRAC